jgi:hypothetical protein
MHFCEPYAPLSEISTYSMINPFKKIKVVFDGTDLKCFSSFAHTPLSSIKIFLPSKSKTPFLVLQCNDHIKEKYSKGMD